nr:immunoglobulin heavy chain junction region [Macaca mulatta]MOW94726.1 immunoglobulin heavy chain junction region [Macaca mulatta]MOW94938.1 immunoglobulin heavy chain junction region [Macaca mulatta]MOW95778.1 immunoglobulin heavy chain junction region [Macaca mulatta]MOW96401.1 immunoglobulin heavy chain junction region [Macaca mulatta]
CARQNWNDGSFDVW